MQVLMFGMLEETQVKKTCISIIYKLTNSINSGNVFLKILFLVAYTFRPDTLWYRGRVYTNEVGRDNISIFRMQILINEKIYLKDGQYNFKLTYPGLYIGRPIPHIHYKVSHHYHWKYFSNTYLPAVLI